MSGYLQRLAAGVLRPARSIHPLVGTLYAPVSQPEAAESLEEFHSESGPAESREAAAGDVSGFESLLGRSPVMQPRRRHSDAGMQIASRSFSEDTPRLPGGSSREDYANGRGSDRAETDQASQPQALRDEIRTETGEYLPLVRFSPDPLPPNLPQASAPHDIREVRGSATKYNRSAGTTGRTRPAPPPSEPDEIQIHIGRIEVTAVPPAATPRPAPRERSKSISLDDYLKHRNGRT